MKRIGTVILGISLLLTGCSNTVKSNESMTNEDYVEKFNTMYHAFFDANYKEYAIKNEYVWDDEGNDIGLYKVYSSSEIDFNWIQGAEQEEGIYSITDQNGTKVYNSNDGIFKYSSTIENENTYISYNNATPFETTLYTYDESKTECNDSTYIFYFDNNVEEYTSLIGIKLEVHVKDDQITDYTIYNYTESYEDGKEPYFIQTYQLITNTPSMTFDDLKEEVSTLEGQEISAMDQYKPSFE